VKVKRIRAISKKKGKSLAPVEDSGWAKPKKVRKSSSTVSKNAITVYGAHAL
jgi:hypothetical protein